MTDLLTTSGDAVALDDGAADDLAAALRGEVIREGDAGYDEARALWNGMLDRRPAMIVRCADTDDVSATVRFAVDHDLVFAVRGGGHNVAGTAGIDDGLVIDLSTMNEVVVDPEARTARAGGGATWADLDGATQPHGLAAPGGLVSETGIGGLTLSGGIGWLRRKHGMSCDNLVAARLVTATGEVLDVDDDADPELMWALRGGGGNFGVVTELTYRLHPVGPEVFVAFVIHRGERSAEVLEAFGAWTTDLADEVTALAMCGAIPEAEEVPESWRGEPGVMIVACAATDLTTAEELTAPIRDLADPIVDLSGPMPYTELQSLFDEDYPNGFRYYWKSLHLPGMDAETVDRLVEWAGTRPSPLTTVDVWHLGGAMARVAPEATAYGDRSAPYLLGIESNWEDPDHDEANVEWTRRCFEAFRSLSTGREYLNFPGFLEDGESMLRSAHGESNYERLARVKARLDPDNRFRLHQNVPPASR
ncbi:MAG: FAD-binding oxidoreductase [Acidimicrobiales bacterium]